MRRKSPKKRIRLYASWLTDKLRNTDLKVQMLCFALIFVLFQIISPSGSLLNPSQVYATNPPPPPPVTRSVTLISSPQNGGTVVSDNDSYVQGDTATLTATAANGYTFLVWTGESVCTGTNRILQIVVNDDITCVANFSLVGAPEDHINPSVSITAPANGATVSGTVNITATASDNDQISRLEFAIFNNGIDRVLSVDLTNPYAYSLDTTTIPNGNYNIRARAYDRSGNMDQVDVGITINNTKTPIYRLYNTKNGAYLYTRGEADKNHILTTWPEFEFTDGVPAYYATLNSQISLTPIYRLYNTSNGAYLYTRGDEDKYHVLSTWPEFEFTDGVPAFYATLSSQEGLTPIYRLYNTLNGMYLYTRGDADKQHVMSTWPEFEFTDGVPAFYASLSQ